MPEPTIAQRREAVRAACDTFTNSGRLTANISIEDVRALVAHMDAQDARVAELEQALRAIQEWLLFTETTDNANGFYLEQFVKANNLAAAALAPKDPHA
jgi:hypothetical protein